VTWGIALVLLAPTFAQAQQTGLFPLAPIRRQRVPCPDENPIYRRYRADYYGYYPTCWRRFPPGWGCLSPEAPNMEQAYKDLKPDPTPPTPDSDLGDEAPEGGRGGRRDDDAPRSNKPEIPGVPSGGPSPLDRPFDLDATPNPNANPAAPRRDSPPAPEALPPGLPPAGAGRPPGALGALNNRPARPAQGIQFQPSNTPIQNSMNDPLLPLPDPPAATTQPISAPVSAEPLGGNFDTGTDNTGMPTQAPRRRSLIGGLFDSLGIKRR
jgi:hypothetical protein